MQYDKETEKTIEEINQKIQELQSKVNELKNENNKCVRWRAHLNTPYIFINSSGKQETKYDWNDSQDNYLYSIGNYFPYCEHEQKYKQHLIITQKLKDIALRLNDGEKIDLKNYFGVAKQKYKIVLKAHSNMLLQAISTSVVDLNQIYCLSPKFLETAIKEIGEQELIDYIKEG